MPLRQSLAKFGKKTSRKATAIKLWWLKANVSDAKYKAIVEKMKFEQGKSKHADAWVQAEMDSVRATNKYFSAKRRWHDSIKKKK